MADEAQTNLPRALGRYEVVGFLAAGGMAEVFLGRVRGPSGFERPVVLKRILPHLARQSSFVDMFLDEARIVARIQHPSVVHVHELAREGGELFMVMEYLEGESVSGLLRRLIARGETLEPSLAAFIVAEACAGLHAAHELKDDDGRSLGVVHRDVSPQNTFVTFSGGVKILDFGIAKAHDRVSRTETGQLKGKLDYMSPEQCLTKALDRRSDVFSLGIVLYELLTLRRLFKRATPLATLKAITEEPVVPPSRLNPDCPKALDAICLRALARDRDERYASAADMRRDLVVALQASPGSALPEERLAALMLRLFPDRKQEKEEMLRRVREGSLPTELPAAEVDDAIEIPVVVAEDPPPISAVEVAGPRARAPLLALAALAAFALAAGIFFVATRTGGTAAIASTSAPASAEATPPPLRTVRVSIESTPPGAAITIDGVAYGPAPVSVSIEAKATKATVGLSLEGYAPLQESIALDADQHLRLTLVPVAKPKPTQTTAGHGSASVKPQATDPLHQKW